MPDGYTKTATGFRAWVRVASKRDDFNELATKSFPPETTPPQIRDWRAQARALLQADLRDRRRRRTELVGGTSSGFRYDAVELYLPAVQAMPTYEQRVKDVMLWVDEFGDRDRHTIKAHEIRAVRDRWLKVGPIRKWQKINGVGQFVDVTAPLSASSVNHRLRALSNLWTVLDGRHAPNPVRHVPEAGEPGAVPHHVDYDTIRRILDAMADRGRPVKGHKRSTESLAKVRARCMAWAGVEPTELGRIAEADVLLAIETTVLAVPERRKGSGAPGRLIPLNEDAIAALKDLVRLKATGPFRGRAVLRAWQIACLKTIGRTLRLKDLRHSFVTNIVATTRDLKLAQLLAGHRDDRTTQRYAIAAMLPLLRAGIDAAFPTPPTPDSSKETPHGDDAIDLLPEAPRHPRRAAPRVPRRQRRTKAAHSETR